VGFTLVFSGYASKDLRALSSRAAIEPSITSSPMVTEMPPSTDGSIATLILTFLPVIFDSAADSRLV
jgi:hypothetical protein